MTPREIAFEDIKKGDDIEARWERDGVVTTLRGIAHDPGSHYWYTEAGGLIANDYDGYWTHFLHARPAPDEPTGLGAVVRAALRSQESPRVFTRVNEGPYGWADASGQLFAWPDFSPESIEVLSEGIEVCDE